MWGNPIYFSLVLRAPEESHLLIARIQYNPGKPHGGRGSRGREFGTAIP